MKSIKNIKSLLEKKRDKLDQEYNIKKLGIFGSYSKGTASKKSDLDILVEFSEPPTIFKFVQLERRLSRILGIKVDLVTKNALKSLMKKEVLTETVFL